MVKKKYQKRISSLIMSALIVAQNFAYLPPMIATAARSAKVSDTENFPEVSGSNDVSAILHHTDQLVDNGDGTFTFTSEITSSYSYFDQSGSRLKFQDGEYVLDKAGTYLVELWGGDGGEGSSLFPLSFKAGKGGSGGFVYGLLKVETDDVGKKLSYEIGSKGLSQTRSVTGGGTNGDGGGAGDIAVFSVGAGGGYSAVYLLDAGETINDEKRNDPSKVLMIAGGGGGGGAGAALHTLPGLFGGAGKANGGQGGTFHSSISENANIEENFVYSENTIVGKYYAGENGTTSGTKGAYVGVGGTDRPGEIVKSFIGFLEASSYPNDWQQTYHPDLHRGVGGAGNFRGGGGGAGFAGGSGGMQNEPLDARNVGGGGGGSSYIGNFSNFTPGNQIDINNYSGYFVQESGNTNSDVGGAVVIRYLSPTSNNYDYLNNITVSGQVSQYFDIVGESIVGENTDEFSATGSVAPVPSGLAKGQQDKKLTLTLKLKPKAGFFGGNNVPIFASNTLSVKSTIDGSKNCSIDLSGKPSVTHVNVPYNLPIKAVNSVAQEGDEIVADELYTGGVAYDSTDPMMTFIEGISYTVEGEDPDDYSYEILHSDVENGGKYFNVVATITPKGEPAVVGEAGSATITKKAYVKCISEKTKRIDGFLAELEKTLSYDDENDTYDLTVNVKADSETHKSFSINEAVASQKVLDISYNANDLSTSNAYVTLTKNGNNANYTGTLQPGIYYVEVWGGDGGNGTNDKYYGYGGKGGYINGYVEFDSTKNLNITLGTKGADGTSSSNGKGGKATYVDIVDQNDQMSFIAGGGGGATRYLHYGATDLNSHMGFSGNDGYRNGGQSVYRGIPSDAGYKDGIVIEDDYYDETKYDGADALSFSGNRISNFDNNNIPDYFAKGGYSETIGEVKNLSDLQSEGIAERLFIRCNNDDISLSALNSTTVEVNRGLYEYVYYFYDGVLQNYYISQWTNKNSDTQYYQDDDDWNRISYYQGTTKLDSEIKTTGAVRITRVGIKAGSDYNGTFTPDETAAGVVTKIQSDYADHYTPFTVTADFTDYFDLQTDSYYTSSNNTGTHTFALSAANVHQISTANETDTETYAGYTLTKHNYVYGLSGTDSVTFKLKPKDGFLGGNDVPLLDSATIEHNNTTPEDDDTQDIPVVNDPVVDYANVKIDGSVLTDDLISSAPKYVEYGEQLSTADLNFSSYPPAGYTDENEWKADYADFDKLTYDPALSTAITSDTDLFVTAAISPDTAQADAEANVIAPVDKAERVYKVPIRVSYPVTNNVGYTSAEFKVVKTNDTEAAITPDGATVHFPTATDQAALVVTLTAASGHDLPYIPGENPTEEAAHPDRKISITGVDETQVDMVKKDGKLIITIPVNAVTGEVKIGGTAFTQTHRVKFMYQRYDPLTKQVTMVQSEKTGYANGAILDNVEFPFQPDPDNCPAGYDANNFWDWTIEKTDGNYRMGQEDVMVVGTYKPITYRLLIKYINGDTEAIMGTYLSPERSNYDEDTDTYDIALTKDAEYSVTSPEFEGYEGYVPDKPIVSGKVTDEVIASMENFEYDSNTYHGLVVEVRYTASTGNVNVHFIGCDIRGVPNGETLDMISINAEAESYDLDTQIDTTLGDSRQKIRVTKLVTNGDKTVEETVEHVSGNASSDTVTYYVYYRAKPETVTVQFKDRDNPTNPNPLAADKICEIGREYSYNHESNTYDSLPRAVKTGYRLVGWENGAGQTIEDDMIVTGEPNSTITLYAKWESSKVTITVRYLYANNIEDVELRGDEAGITKNEDYEYGSSYSIKSYVLSGYSAEPETVKGYALDNKTETVYYRDDHDDVVTITVNVYSESYENDTSGAPKLCGGTFGLFTESGEPLGEQENTDGTLVWDNIAYNIESGNTYVVKCIDPPFGYGTDQITIAAGESKNMFLGKSPFELPFAGSTPLTVYTVTGISIMALAVFLLFNDRRRKTEYEKNETIKTIF